MLLLYTVLLYATTVLISGCEPNSIADPLFSTELGATSLYKLERHTTDGMEETRHGWTNLSIQKSNSNISIDRRNLNNHQETYKISNNGVFLAEKSRDKFLMPRNLQKNDTWQTSVYATALQTSQPPWEKTLRPLIIVPMVNRVLSVNEDIWVANNLYKDCVLVESVGNAEIALASFIGNIKVTISSKTWFARNIGIIKQETRELTDSDIIKSGNATLTLLSYSK